MAYKNENQLIEFYKQCIKNGYTDMQDDKQSLKAKVIAVDLGIKYKSIDALFRQAEELYNEKERLRVTDGAFLFELDNSENNMPDKMIALYRRADGSLYHTINGNKEKIEGAMYLNIKGSKTLSFTYNPSKTIYTGATVGGITTGGFHQTQASYTEHMHSTEKAYLEASSSGVSFEVFQIILSPKMREKFKRSLSPTEQETGKISCSQKGGAVTQMMRDRMLPTDYNTLLTYASHAVDEQRLSADAVARRFDILVNIINENYPETDDELYNKALDLYKSARTSYQFKEAEQRFEEIAPFHDGAKSMAGRAKQKYEEALQEEKEARILEQEAQQRARKKGFKLFLTVGVPLILLCAVGIFALNKYVLPAKRYQQAQSLMQEGRYEEAITAFDALGEYQDSKAQIDLANRGIEEQNRANEYAAALSLLSQGQYSEAEKAFRVLGDYQDSQARIEECLAGRYNQAQTLLNEAKYDDAIQAFSELGEYSNSQMQVNEAQFGKAKSLISAGDYKTAYEILVPLKDYSNVSDYLNDFYFLPSVITCRSGSYVNTYEFVYDSSLKMTKAVYTLNNDEMHICVFDEEGRLIQTLLGSYYNDRAGTVSSTYSYNADNTVLEYFMSGEARQLFDEYGNLVEMYGTEGTRTGGKVWKRDYPTDEHHNRTDNSENKYKNDLLVSVYYSKGNLRKSTTIDYLGLYVPEVDVDTDTIWRNIRMLCVDTIWYS